MQIECTKCGTSVSEGTNFCPNCGTKVESNKSCPDCGEEVEKEASFCGQCGKELSISEAKTIETGEGVILHTTAKNEIVADDIDPKEERSGTTSYTYPVLKWVSILTIPVIVVLAIVLAQRSGKVEQVPSGGVMSPPGGSEVMEQVFREIEALKEQIEVDPKNTAALVRLGNMYRDAGKFEQAIDYYNRSLEADSTNVDVRVEIAVCYFNAKEPQRAIQELTATLKYDSKHPDALFYIGGMNASVGKWQEAEMWWGKLIELYPDDHMAHMAKEALEGR